MIDVQPKLHPSLKKCPSYIVGAIWPPNTKESLCNHLYLATISLDVPVRWDAFCVREASSKERRSSHN